MGDYSITEIGMLAGAVIGGLLAVIGFLATGSMAFLLTAAAGIVAGTAVGKVLDGRKTMAKEKVMNREKE